MRVVTVARLVLDVGHVDGDTALALFRGLVDLVERGEGGPGVGVGEHLGDRGGEGGLAVVNVTHGANVDVWLGPLELLLCHGWLLLHLDRTNRLGSPQRSPVAWLFGGLGRIPPRGTTAGGFRPLALSPQSPWRSSRELLGTNGTASCTAPDPECVSAGL